MRSFLSLAVVALVAMTLSACTTEPQTPAARDDLSTNIDQTLKRLETQDPSLQSTINNAYAYAVFPSVGKGGAIVGGAYGHGEVYQGGGMIGYTDISQATIGAQLGGETFAEIILFQSQDALTNFQKGNLQFAANATAVALKSGAAASGSYQNGVLALVEPKEGLMVEAAIGGQSFSYQPK